MLKKCTSRLGLMMKFVFKEIGMALILGTSLSLAVGCKDQRSPLVYNENFKPTFNPNGGGTDNLQLPTLPIEAATSFANLSKNILTPRCQRCHDQESELPLVTHSQYLQNKEAVYRTVIVDRSMPPKKKLSEAEIQLLKIWIEAGMPVNGVKEVQGSGTGSSSGTGLGSGIGQDSGTTTLPPILGAESKGCAKFDEKNWKKMWRWLSHDVNSDKKWQNIEQEVYQGKLRCFKSAKQGGNNTPQKVTEKQERLSLCFSNLENFVRTQKITHQDGHHMQFLASDQEYLSSRRPELLSLPTELSNGLPENWRKICQDKGWTCLPFVSKSLPNPSRLSFKRLLIIIDGADYDKWMLFTTDADNGSDERLIDFMAIEKTEQVGNQITQRPRPLMHFAEYWRDRNGAKPEFRKDIASCYKCHPSGMKDIVPAYGSVARNQLPLVDKINKRIADYGRMDWGQNSVNINHYGPAMGEKQGCLECHNGRLRGEINAAHLGERSRHQIYFKMGQDLTMPPQLAKQNENKDLFSALDKAWDISEKEREKLYNPRPFTPIISNINIGLGGVEGPVAVENDKVLDFLEDKNYLSKSELSEAKKALKRLEEKAKKEFEQMLNDYRPRLEQWLKGESIECQNIFAEK